MQPEGTSADLDVTQCKGVSVVQAGPGGASDALPQEPPTAVKPDDGNKASVPVTKPAVITIVTTPGQISSQPKTVIAPTTPSTKIQPGIDPKPPPTPSQAKICISLANVSQASKVIRLPTVTPSPGKGVVITLPKASATPRAPNNTSVQLPANFQVPQGMVLIRSDSGQLMLVSQQALAQAQAQGIVPRPAAISTTSTVRVPGPQVTVATVIKKQSDTPQVIKVSAPTTSTTVTPVQKVSLVRTASTVLPSTSAQIAHPAPLVVVPTKATTVKIATTPTISTEVLENVKKCKNFLVTLIKLASSGTHSADMAKNVKDLVKSLLDGKIEAEEFTNRLYTELKSSPQPCLVPFLKRSLPTIRQLTPNSQLFIQQCTEQQSANKPAASTKTIALTLKAEETSRSAQLVVQQPKCVVLKQPMTSVQTPVSIQTRNAPAPPVATLRATAAVTGPIIKQQVGRVVITQSPIVPKANYKESTAGSFRDEDDINDVASMAGVNLSEENARILATNAEHVGVVVRSCTDDPFLPAVALHKRTVDIAQRHGVEEVSPDALSLLSHATQERLRDLLEKVTEVAQHRVIMLKDDSKHRQTSDTRCQLKFLEQLDRLEKQRKDEQEREVLLRAAKSRCNREDPEYLRLKQRAKEMQQLELAQIQQRDANLTALAAIGPRKKRPLDSLGGGLGNEVLGPKLFSQPKTTRVCLRDLLFCMEQDPSLRHSLCLYRALIK